MGGSNYNRSTYSMFSTSARTKSTNQLFTQQSSRKVHDLLDPKNFKIRECRISPNHPKAQAIGVFVDVTSSMGHIPKMLLQQKLGTLMEILIDKGIVDPALLFGSIGDKRDEYPCQVGQFESGTTELIDNLSKIYIEGGGWGDVHESYLYAWYVMARRTSIDCFEKFGKKGYLFTIGDEACHSELTKHDLEKVFGPGEYPERISDIELYNEASRKYNVYHIHCNDGSYPNLDMVLDYWKNLMQENFIVLDSHEFVAETIAARIALAEGVNIISSLGSASTVVQKALSSVTTTSVSNGNSGVIKL